MSGLRASRWASMTEEDLAPVLQAVQQEKSSTAKAAPTKEDVQPRSVTDEVEQSQSSRAASADAVAGAADESDTNAAITTTEEETQVQEVPQLNQPEEADPANVKPVSDKIDVQDLDDNKLVEAVQEESVQETLNGTNPTNNTLQEVKRIETPSIKLTEEAAEQTTDVQPAQKDIPSSVSRPGLAATETGSFRLEPPRLKKRISWRGKNCLINIPSWDYAALGLPVPLSPEEVRQRLQHFEDEGYSTAGFDNDVTSDAHVKPIYPDETEQRKPSTRAVVALPDLNAWRNYMDALTEAKLAALGVSLGLDEPAEPAQDMSRQSSGQFQTFSPPIPTGSAPINGRPGFVRGHSHTMSVASPIQPGNGPFGHMHRHSTFHGFNPMQGLQSFSPIPQIQQVPSPAQFNTLRNDIGLMRSGSPLSQSMTPELHQDQQDRRMQAGFQQPPLPPSNFLPLRNEVPVLPELPEDEDEDELSDPTPYLPPHKRAQINDEIAVPTPRGHRHNISEGLEREVMLTEQHENGKAMPRFNGFSSAPKVFGQISDKLPDEKDPLGGDVVVASAGQRHKKSGSRFNMAAPAFTFNPTATFQPGQTAFNPAGSAFAFKAPQHTRQTSSGNFNVAAPEFKPAGLDKFTFTADSSLTDGSTKESSDKDTKNDKDNIVAQLPSIFGKIDIPDIVKQPKKSKAIAIKQPGELSNKSASATDAEDNEGRIDRSDDRLKRTRRVGGDDGDDVPAFAVPGSGPILPQPPVLPSQPDKDEKPLPKLPVDADAEIARVQADSKVDGVHKPNGSLSALAKPWQPSFSFKPETGEKPRSESVSSIGDDELPLPAPKSNYEFPARETIIDTAPNGASFDEIDAVMQHLNADAQPDVKTEEPDASYEVQPGVTYIPAWPRSDAPSPSPRRHVLHPHHTPAEEIIAEEKTNGNVWPQVNRLNNARDTPSDWSDILSPGDDEKLQARSSFFDNRVNEVIGKLLNDRLRPFEQALQGIQLSLNSRPTALEQPRPKHRGSSTIDSDADDEDETEAFAQRPISRGRDQKLGHIKSVVLEALREQSPRRSQSSYDISDLHSALADMKVSFARAASATLELDDIRAIVEDVVSRQPPPSVDDDTVQTHKRQVTELEGRLNETLTSRLEQANQIHDIEQREAEARRMLKLAEEELKLLREDNHDDDSRVQALHEERKSLLEQVDNAQEAQSKAELRIQSLQDERKKLLEQVEDAEDAQSKAEVQVENLQAENEALEATLKEYRLSSDKWRQAVEESKIERHELTGTISVLERQLQETQDSGHSMRRRLEKLDSDLATVMGQLASDKSRTKTREEGFRVQCEALEGQIAIHEREKLQLHEETRAIKASHEQEKIQLQANADANKAAHEQDKLRLQSEANAIQIAHEEAKTKLQDEFVAIRTAFEQEKLQLQEDARALMTLHEQEKLGMQEELRNLQPRVAESDEARQAIEGLRLQTITQDETVLQLRNELAEQQRIAAHYEQAAKEASEVNRVEAQRLRMAYEMEIEGANHKVNLVRAGLESEVAQVRAELENVRFEADAAKEKHALLLEEEAETRHESLRTINATNSVALEAARTKYEMAIRDLTQQHGRSLGHAIEDKERSEYLLNERLALADSKLQHFQDKILHLEERVEIAKSAAQAAAMSAQTKTSLPRGLPEKVSPQALRESILVLQEQLQERETRIESLQSKLNDGDAAKVKERDTEIAWLRELLAVRSEDLTDLVNTLSKPTFDRDNVRDVAIRIRANLQMEQQEKERFGQKPILSNQAMASLSSFATPKAAQLTSAFNKWRSSMESAALKGRPARPPRSATPSRASSANKPPSYLSGLMTPPASNLRSSPSPETAPALPQPQLKAPHDEDRSEAEAEPSTPTLLETADYDDDAEDRPVAVEDDDLNVADSQPPAFRSLEDELEPSEEEDAQDKEEEVGA